MDLGIKDRLYLATTVLEYIYCARGKSTEERGDILKVPEESRSFEEAAEMAKSRLASSFLVRSR